MLKSLEESLIFPFSLLSHSRQFRIGVIEEKDRLETKRGNSSKKKPLVCDWLKIDINLFI